MNKISKKVTEFTFPSIVVNNRYYTLDGKIQVPYYTYNKGVDSLEDITIEELQYIITNYLNIKRALDSLIKEHNLLK